MKDTEYLSVVLVTEHLTDAYTRYIESMHAALDERFRHFEVIVICNGTIEGIDVFQKKLGALTHPTIVMTLPHRHSHEIAGYVGLQYAKGDYVLEVEYPSAPFDGAALAALFERLRSGYDIVGLTPGEGTVPWFSRLFYRLLKNTSVVPLSLETEYARLVTRRALNALFQLRQRISYRKLLYAYTGFKRSHIDAPQSYVPLHGQRPRLSDRLHLSLDVFITYTTLAIRTTLALALVFLLLSVLGGLYALVIYFYKDVRIEGWTTLMLFTSLGLSGIFVILALMVKYLESILRETQSAPLYVAPTVDITLHNETHPHV